MTATQPTEKSVQLGCGTLIVIAIIVMVFSGGRESRRTRTQLDELNRKVDRLEKKIDELSEKLSRLPPSQPALEKIR